MVARSCEPQIRYDLAAGTGSDPYTGLDRFGRVIDLLWRNYGTSEDVVRIKHGYDRAGNRLYREDPLALAHGVDMDEAYRYDGLYQLKTFTRGALSAQKTAIAAPTFRQTWDFDATGNWSRFREDRDADGKWDLDQTRQHNAANEITAIDASVGDLWISPTHDRAGNMLRIPQPNDPTKQFTLKWDAWNRLVRVSDAESTVAEYSYDGRNYRILKRVYRDPSDPLTLLTFPLSHYTYHTNDWRVIEDHSTTESPAPRPESLAAGSQHIWGLRYIDDLILRDRNADGVATTGTYGLAASGLEERLYALQDPNWNMVAISGTDGAVVERYRYAAYGKCQTLHAEFTDRSGTARDWSSLYTGRESDRETELYYYRARFYDAITGQFVARDPLGYPDGDANARRYLASRPTVRNDPLGLAVDLNVPCRTLTQSTIWLSFDDCTADQRRTLSDRMCAAAQGAGKAVDEIGTVSEFYGEGAPVYAEHRAIVNRVLPYLNAYFGTPTGEQNPGGFRAVGHVGKSDLVRIAATMATVSSAFYGRIGLECECSCSGDLSLYVYSGPVIGFLTGSDIHVCPRFWNLEARRQSARLLHEISHYYAGTEDFGYVDVPGGVTHAPQMSNPSREGRIELCSAELIQNAATYEAVYYALFL
jgi:RHS repeat-associated protein